MLKIKNHKDQLGVMLLEVVIVSLLAIILIGGFAVNTQYLLTQLNKNVTTLRQTLSNFRFDLRQSSCELVNNSGRNVYRCVPIEHSSEHHYTLLTY